MKVASLFTGAGGLDLGLQQAGHEIILQCESDPGAQQVLAQHFPGKLLLPDVKAIQSLPEETELLVAGIPCIDVSSAGHRKGAAGLSTGCGRHVFRLLRVAARNNHPIPWLLLENVEAFLNRHEDGADAVVKCIVEAVEELGFRSWAYRIINTAGFGVPHQRRRMLFLASMHADVRDLLLSTGMRPCTGGCEDRYGEGRMCFRCLRAEEVPIESTSYALDMGNARNTGTPDMIPTMTRSNQRMLLLLADGRSGLLRIADAERLQGFPEGWTEPCWPVEGPGIVANRPHTANSGADDDASKRVRYALLGNAVSVCVARWLGAQLMEPYKHKYVGHPQDRPMDAAAVKFADDFGADVDMDGVDDLELGEEQSDWKGHSLRKRGSASKQVQAASIAASGDVNDGSGEAGGGCGGRTGAWPRAAWFVKGLGRWASSHLSDAPEVVPLTRLGKFIQQPGKLPSEEALRIYIMRLREGGFHVDNLLAKIRQCKLSAGSQVARIVLGDSHKAANITGSPGKAAAAAKAAARIGQRGRCGACLTCKQQRQGSSRRCLQLRAAAAAAGGHAGAQIAITKEAAVGKRIAIWWANDEEWYEGVITQFDQLRWSHTVEYDDGDSEVVSLWAPHEMVQLRKAGNSATLQQRASKRRRVLTEAARVIADAKAEADAPAPDAGTAAAAGTDAVDRSADRKQGAPKKNPPATAPDQPGKPKPGKAVNKVREAAAAAAAAAAAVVAAETAVAAAGTAATILAADEAAVDAPPDSVDLQELAAANGV